MLFQCLASEKMSENAHPPSCEMFGAMNHTETETSYSLGISGMRVSNNRGMWNVGTVKSLMKVYRNVFFSQYQWNESVQQPWCVECWDS